MNEIILSIQQLDKYFGKRHVIDHLSFDVRAGEIFGFLGPNGAGKTTTIKLVMGFLREDGGKIFINGIDKKENYETAMSYLGGIVENPEMYGNFTGRQNLRMYARTHGGIEKSRVDEIIRLVGLDKRIDEKVKRYSLGMKQRVGLAQALVHKPKMLILDEPTNGLDPVGIHNLRDILRRLAHEEGIAVMVSSHILAEMQLMCDRVGIIDKGRLIDIKDVRDLGGSKDDNGYQTFVLKVGFTEDKTLDQDLILPSLEGESADEGEALRPATAQTGRETAVITEDAPSAEAALHAGGTSSADSWTDRALAVLPDTVIERIKSRNEDSLTLLTSEAELQQILSSLVGAGIPVVGVSREQASLEDLYMSVTGGGMEIA